MARKTGPEGYYLVLIRIRHDHGSTCYPINSYDGDTVNNMTDEELQYQLGCDDACAGLAPKSDDPDYMMGYEENC